MPIERVEHVDGSWEEKATDPKSARELFEKHAPALQKRGAEDFHQKWIRDQGIGFEAVRDPAGNPTHVRADRVDSSLASGYRPMNLPRTTVPYLPWQADRRFGERYEDYKRRTSGLQAEEAEPSHQHPGQ